MAEVQLQGFSQGNCAPGGRQASLDTGAYIVGPWGVPSLSRRACIVARTCAPFFRRVYITARVPLSSSLAEPSLSPSPPRRRIPPTQQISRPKPGIGKGGVELRPTERGGGGVVTIVRPDVRKETQKKEKTEREPTWRVLLHNDEVHTFDYVTGAIVKVVRTVSRKKAHRITMQAHASGVATVTTTWKALAEEYCKGLQMHGLTSSIAPDSSFKL